MSYQTQSRDDTLDQGHSSSLLHVIDLRLAIKLFQEISMTFALLLLLFIVYLLLSHWLFAFMETPGLHHNGKKKKNKTKPETKLKTTQISFTKLQRIIRNISFFQPRPVLEFMYDCIFTNCQITALPSLYHNQYFPLCGAYTFPHFSSTSHCFPCRKFLLPYKGLIVTWICLHLW